jgi:hypothetical protein
MIVRVNWHIDWNAPKAADAPSQGYHLYSCKDLGIGIHGFSGSSNGPSGPSRVTLNMDNGTHLVDVEKGDEVFIMNDEGRTVDVIRTV